MGIHARVYLGKVIEIFENVDSDTGEEISMESLFCEEVLEQFVDVTNVEPKPQERWFYDGEVFTPPV